jgi:hypothetical protein
MQKPAIRSRAFALCARPKFFDAVQLDSVRSIPAQKIKAPLKRALARFDVYVRCMNHIILRCAKHVTGMKFFRCGRFFRLPRGGVAGMFNTLNGASEYCTFRVKI